VPAMSLAGVPPLSGFWAKLILIRAALDERAFVYVAVALLVGMMTLFSMTKIWAEAFWKSPGAGEGGAPGETAPRTPAGMLAPIAVLAAITAGIGLGARPVFEFSVLAAGQLLDPEVYVVAVLGEAFATPVEGVEP